MAVKRCLTARDNQLFPGRSDLMALEELLFPIVARTNRPHGIAVLGLATPALQFRPESSLCELMVPLSFVAIYLAVAQHVPQLGDAAAGNAGSFDLQLI
jgi:hypothetical protein